MGLAREDGMGNSHSACDIVVSFFPITFVTALLSRDNINAPIIFMFNPTRLVYLETCNSQRKLAKRVSKSFILIAFDLPADKKGEYRAQRREGLRGATVLGLQRDMFIMME
jgi:hypothetical protein